MFFNTNGDDTYGDIFTIQDSINNLNDGLVIRSIGKDITLYPKIGKAYYQKNNAPYEILSKYVISDISSHLTITDGVTINSFRLRLVDEFIFIYNFSFTLPDVISSNGWFTIATLDDTNFYSTIGITMLYTSELSNSESFCLRELYFENGEFKIYLTTKNGGQKGYYQGITIKNVWYYKYIVNIIMLI